MLFGAVLTLGLLGGAAAHAAPQATTQVSNQFKRELSQRLSWEFAQNGVGLAYSITSSARASTDGGTVRSSVFAVLRLTTT